MPYGNKHERSFIINILTEKLHPLTFIPITVCYCNNSTKNNFYAAFCFQWTVNGSTVTFYVDNFKVAAKLHSLDREFLYPDGHKVIIKVHNGAPVVEITSQMKEKMKLAMAKRYNAATKALDLTMFHADPDLQDVFCALFKPVVFLAVIDIIAENIPEIEALNLHENKLQILSHLKKMVTKLPNIKILHLGNNKVGIF